MLQGWITAERPRCIAISANIRPLCFLDPCGFGRAYGLWSCCLKVAVLDSEIVRELVPFSKGDSCPVIVSHVFKSSCS